MFWKSENIKVAVVDHQRIFRQLLEVFFKKSSEFELVGGFGCGASFIESLRNGSCEIPEIAIIDFDLPEASGKELTLTLKTLFPKIKVIVLSMRHYGYVIAEMIDSGVASFLEKSCGVEEFRLALQSVAKTGYYLNEQILTTMREIGNSDRRSKMNNTDGITIRETEVLEYICEELTNAEIAERLHLSVRTVDGHRKNLLLKTNSRNTAGLVMYAVKNNFVKV